MPTHDMPEPCHCALILCLPRLRLFYIYLFADIMFTRLRARRRASDTRHARVDEMRAMRAVTRVLPRVSHDAVRARHAVRCAMMQRACA